MMKVYYDSDRSDSHKERQESIAIEAVGEKIFVSIGFRVFTATAALSPDEAINLGSALLNLGREMQERKS